MPENQDTRPICPVCNLRHQLLKCFYAFPEFAPDGFQPREHLQKWVEENLQKKEVINQLRKIKNKRCKVGDEEEDKSDWLIREVGRCPSSFYISQARGASFSIAQYSLRNSAILDSGTNIDVFNEVSQFLNFCVVPDDNFLWAGTQKVYILGYGDVNIVVDEPVGKQLLQLNDVVLL